MHGPQLRSQDLNLAPLLLDGLPKFGTLGLQLLGLNLQKIVNPLKFHFDRGSLSTRWPAVPGCFIWLCKRCRLRAFLSLLVRLFVFRSVWPGQRWKGDQSQCYRTNRDCSHRCPLIAVCQSPKHPQGSKTRWDPVIGNLCSPPASLSSLRKLNTENVRLQFYISVLNGPETQRDRCQFVHDGHCVAVLSEVHGLDVMVASIASIYLNVAELVCGVDRQLLHVFLRTGGAYNSTTFPLRCAQPTD